MNSAHIEEQLKKFWEWGYMVIPRGIPFNIADDALAKLTAANATPSLKLKQSDEFKALKDAGKKVVKQFQMRWTTRQWVAIKSRPCGEEQEPRHSFPGYEIGRARKQYPETIQAVMVIGLMPSTRLIVYRGCFAEADPDRRTVLEFGPSDCVIFRGDLAHNNASFDTLNYRVHCMLLVKGVDWSKSAPELTPVTTFKCAGCPFLASSRLEVRNHRKYCLHNPCREAIASRYREINNAGKMCDICKKFFAKRNSYYKHWARRHRNERP